MELDGIILSEISQKERDIYEMFSNIFIYTKKQSKGTGDEIHRTEITQEGGGEGKGALGH